MIRIDTLEKKNSFKNITPVPGEESEGQFDQNNNNNEPELFEKGWETSSLLHQMFIKKQEIEIILLQKPPGYFNGYKEIFINK